MKHRFEGEDKFVDDSSDEDEDEEEEDPEDPQDKLKEACGENRECRAYAQKLEKCTERVSSRSNTKETCEEELFDFLHCRDKCVAKQLFKHLK